MRDLDIVYRTRSTLDEEFGRAVRAVLVVYSESNVVWQQVFDFYRSSKDQGHVWVQPDHKSTIQKLSPCAGIFLVKVGLCLQVECWLLGGLMLAADCADGARHELSPVQGHRPAVVETKALYPVSLRPWSDLLNGRRRKRFSYASLNGKGIDFPGSDC